jgi:hypothetical protein
MNTRDAQQPTELARSLWRKSTKSGGGNCVEVASMEGTVLVRNSNASPGAILSFLPSEWAIFLISVRGGEFD